MTATETRSARPRRSLAAIAIAAGLAATAFGAGGAGVHARGAGGDSAGVVAAKPGSKSRPNVIVVMSDDQTVADMRVLPKVQRLIGDRGVTFANNFASNPTCCPSRSTFFSGRYGHNTGVFRNSVPAGGFESFDGSETLPVWLQRAGYSTAHVGKYLNGYGGVGSPPTYVPPGWSDWYGSVDPTTYRMYGYTLNQNGQLVDYGDYDTEDPATYQTDVYAQKGVEFIERQAQLGTPFFLSMAPLAPHVEVFTRPSEGEDDPPTPTFPNPRPAPRDAGAFRGAKLPTGPSFNEADISDKPEGVRGRPLLSSTAISQARKKYRSRLASLLAVDDMVGRLVRTLRRTGELDDTVIMFVSDNGFLLGEHRIPTGKQYPYEESIRVPLEIRGPGIPKGQVREQLAANVDLAPTILRLTGAQPRGPIDGRSLLPMIKGKRRYNGRAIVLENWCQTSDFCYDPDNPLTPRYRGVRTDRYAYMRYPNGEQEMYDLERDPEELDSLHNSRRYADERAALSRLLDQVELCEQQGCQASPRLKLKLSRRGGGCVRSAVRVRIGGPDGRDAVSAELFARGAAGADDKPPLRLRVQPSELSKRARTRISANVAVLDGRIKTVSGSVPRAC